MIIKIILIQHLFHINFIQMLNKILNFFLIMDNQNIIYIINFMFLNKMT